MENVRQLASDFRRAMDNAKNVGAFTRSTSFSEFPRGCCGDTCYLLAEYLLERGIRTEYVWGLKGSQSHAWLVVAEEDKQRYHKFATNPLKCMNKGRINA